MTTEVTTTQITTNNVPRDLIYAYELPIDVVERDFPYLNLDINEDYNDQYQQFFKYKGEYYALSDMDSSCPGSQVATMFPAWNGYQTLSFFDGIVIKWPHSDCCCCRRCMGSGYCGNIEVDYDRVIVGRFYSS